MFIFLARSFRALLRIPLWTIVMGIFVALLSFLSVVFLMASLVSKFRRTGHATENFQFAKALLFIAALITTFWVILLPLGLLKYWSNSDTEVIRNLLGETAHPAEILGNARRFAAALHDEQNTHIASVHRSVSESASRLMQRYGQDKKTLEANIQPMKRHILQRTGHDIKLKAAQTAIKRLTATSFFSSDIGYFSDPRSKVSIRQLLGLIYTAIHDDEQRTGALEDAWNLIIEGLYEIQRGYNLNENNVDDGDTDSPICAGGTFNKLIEKLEGLHSDVSICHITQEVAIMKFPVLAHKHVLLHLQTLPPLLSLNLLQKLTTAGNLEPIWAAIKNDVQAELWQEFHEAYNNNPDHEKLQELIQYGQELAPPDLNKSPTTWHIESLDTFSFWKSNPADDWAIPPTLTEQRSGPGYGF